MGMEVLRCQSPKLVPKELEMFFIAYNLIRILMAQAGAIYEVPMERLSFKGTVDAVRQFSSAMAQARSSKKQKCSVPRFFRELFPFGFRGNCEAVTGS